MVAYLQKCIIAIVNLIFYGNFWIAACAWAMYQQNHWIWYDRLDQGPVAIQIFFGTLFLYAIHRTVGIQKVQSFSDQGRYLVIKKFKRHIQIYALIGFIGATIGFLMSPARVQLALIIPAFVSLGYVLPLIQGGKRLRDFGHIKIWLVALIWAWLTVLLPALKGAEIPVSNFSLLLFFIERFCFIFAITIPFDIRDLTVDQHTDVHTLPAQWGIVKVLYLAFLLLFISIGCVGFNFVLGAYTLEAAIALTLFYGLVSVLVYYSKNSQNDYYFTGIMDGTMLLSFVIVYFIQ